MNFEYWIIEAVGWLSTAAFLFSILIPRRVRLHEHGMFTSVTTGVYAYYHGATAIWVKWVIALVFQWHMWRKLRSSDSSAGQSDESPRGL